MRVTPDKGSPVTVSLVRNGVDQCSESVRGPDIGASVNELVFEDIDDLDAIAIRGARFHPEPFVVYYVRALASDASCQWSGPIWLDLEN